MSEHYHLHGKERSLKLLGLGVFASLALAALALVVAIGMCFVEWRFGSSLHYLRAHRGDSYLMFRGDDDNKLFGTVSRTYGDELAVTRIERLSQ